MRVDGNDVEFFGMMYVVFDIVVIEIVCNEVFMIVLVIILIVIGVVLIVFVVLVCWIIG